MGLLLDRAESRRQSLRYTVEPKRGVYTNLGRNSLHEKSSFHDISIWAGSSGGHFLSTFAPPPSWTIAPMIWRKVCLSPWFYKASLECSKSDFIVHCAFFDLLIVHLLDLVFLPNVSVIITLSCLSLIKYPCCYNKCNCPVFALLLSHHF